MISGQISELLECLAFLLPTSPWGGSEVMLVRNTLICEDNERVKLPRVQR